MKAYKRIMLSVSLYSLTNAMHSPQEVPNPTLNKTMAVTNPQSVGFTPDNTKVVITATQSSQNSPGQLLIYDRGLNTQISKFEYEYAVDVADISSDSHTLCLTNANTHAQIVSLDSGKVVSWLPDSSIRSTTVQYNKEGTKLLYSSPNGVYIYDLTGKKVTNILSEYCQSRVAYFNPTDNSIIAIAQELPGSSQNGVRLWDLKARKSIREFKPKPEPVYQLAFNPMGDSLVCGQVSYLSVWDTNSGKETELLNGAGKLVTKPSSKKCGAFQIIQFMAGKNIFFAPINTFEHNGAILECDIDAPASNIRFGQLGQDMSKCVTSIAESPDDQTLLAARELDNTVCVWDVFDANKSKQKTPLKHAGDCEVS